MIDPTRYIKRHTERHDFVYDHLLKELCITLPGTWPPLRFFDQEEITALLDVLGEAREAITLEGAYRCACPFISARCVNPVGAEGGRCGPCSTGDHSGHREGTR